MRIADVGLHSAKAEDYHLIAFARQIFGGMERLVERYAKSTFEQNRKLLLSAHDL